MTQPREAIGQFVAEQCGYPDYTFWGNFTALADATEGGIKVGLVYNHFVPSLTGMHDCMLSIAARDNAKWATKEFLYHIFAYPFLELGCRRVTAAIAKKNKRSRRLVERLGFTLEGSKKEGVPGDDILFYRLFKTDCQWIEYE